MQYPGQEETEPFVRVSVVLDGPGGMLQLQDMLDTPVDDVRVGMRVAAVWRPAAERNVDELAAGGWSSTDGGIEGWMPTGEPDADVSTLARKGSTDGRRRDRRVRADAVGAQHRDHRDADGARRHAAGRRHGGHRPPRHRLHVCRAAATTSPGRPFAFVQNLEAVGAWPPISESHVEMDGAWALYEAWVRLQHGDIDIALVYGSGKSSPGKPEQIYPLQLDPYYLAPLGLDPVSLAALQARALLDAGQGHRARLRRDRRPQPRATRSATRTRR